MATIKRTWITDLEEFQPDDVLGYRAARETRNIVHTLIGGGTAVTHRGGKPRAGTLSFLFDSEAVAADCVRAHSEPGWWDLVEPTRPTIAMRYVVSGNVSIALDDVTHTKWLVDVDYQEIDAT